MNGKTSKILRRILSLLLVSTIFITAQAMPVTADAAETTETEQTVGATESKESAEITEIEQLIGATEPEEPKEATELEELTEITEPEESAEIAGTVEATEQAEMAETGTIQPLGIAESSPANPVHHCTKQDDGSDTTDWSYVYFGSYPQTEIIGDALTLAIENASYNKSGDAWVDGIKYRRISKSDTNNSDYFGDSQYRYFKWERIKWRVLQNDGSTLFLMADKGLDCREYSGLVSPKNWVNCDLRYYGLNAFYGRAFSSSEQEAIVAQDVENWNNPDYGTSGGIDTRDKIYLFSIAEVKNPKYGFCESASTNSVSRRVQASDYAHVRGAFIDDGNSYKGDNYWWLRSPGVTSNFAAVVNSDGSVSSGGRTVEEDSTALVPVLHINLSSALWSMTDDGTSGEGGDGGTDGEYVSNFGMASSAEGTVGTSLRISGSLLLCATAVSFDKEIDKITWTSSDSAIIDPSSIQCSKIESTYSRATSLLITAVPKKAGIVTVTGRASNGQTAVCEVMVEKPWSYVYFGSYPQTEVTGDALTSAIMDASYDGDGDAWVDGIKYRRISKSDTKYDDYFGDAEYRYFKWERIKWRVLKNDGSTLFLAADKGLDCKDYNETVVSITWENCTLRSWLNREFYGTAFSSSEQAAIVVQDVGNEDNPYYHTEGGNDTRDNVYLLSIGEVINPEYGFCEDCSTYSASRRVQASDYAHARGGWINTSISYKGSSKWWLRSPGNYTNTAADVNDNGYVNRSGNYVYNGNRVCVPALHINLSSDLWFETDDGTSGEGGNGGTSGKTCQHTWDAGKETKKPTCTEKGTRTYTCTACSETKTEEIPPTGHQHTEVRNQKASTCSEAGYTGDKYCMDCKKTIETGKALEKTAHNYATITAKATLSKAGSITKKCSVCGETAASTAIGRIQSVKLGKVKYVYNKKAQKPAVTIKDSKGKQIASKYYTVTYKNNKKVGKAAVTIRFKGNYEGTVTKTFQIVPKPTNITKVVATAKGFQVAWKKQPESTTGYQVQYSTNKKFTKKATKAKTVKKSSATKLSVKKLKAKKKYYVRIRTYKTMKGKNYYSSWSKTKTVKTGR